MTQPQMPTPVPSNNRPPRAKRGFRPVRALRYQWIKLLRLKGDPVVIARGIAVGTFVGITPTIPFHTILIIIFCGIFRANLIAAVISNWLVSNPISIPIEYYLSWKIGEFIFGSGLGSWQEIEGLLTVLRHASILEGAKLIAEKGTFFITSMTLGGCILASPFAILAYFSYIKWYVYRQKRRYEKFLQTKSKKEIP